jgi:hypothetical protein
MVKRKAVMIATASLAVVVVVGLVTAQMTRRTERRLVSQIQRQQHMRDDATPIQDGVATDKQKKHARLFKGYSDVTRGRKIRDLVTERGDVDVRREVGDVMVPASLNLNDYLQNLTCKADAALIGVVKSKSSQITEDGTFIFTDYELTAEDVLKNNAASAIQPNSDITVTRIGGAVKINGHTARATDFSQRPLQVGERYVLFLRFVPDTGAYMYLSNWGDDSFQIRGSKISQVSATPLPLGTGRTTDLTLFINETRNAVNNGCLK